MNNIRKHPRENCYAKILCIDENLPGYVRDISREGFKFEFINDIAWNIGDRKKIRLIPNEGLNINLFLAEVEVKWIKHDIDFWIVGGQIISGLSDNEKIELNKLIDYYDIKGENR